MNDGRFATEINSACYIRSISWLAEAWNSYAEAKISDSFKRCGITASEEILVNDLKPDIIILN